MKRRHHEQRWECRICNCFHSLSLRTLLSHYNKVHGNEPNFRVVCNVDDCPAIFTKYNSLYKHVKRCHGDIYNVTMEENPDAEFRNTITDDSGINNDGLNIDQDSDNGIDGGSTSTSSDEFEIVQDQVCTVSLYVSVIWAIPLNIGTLPPPPPPVKGSGNPIRKSRSVEEMVFILNVPRLTGLQYKLTVKYDMQGKVMISQGASTSEHIKGETVASKMIMRL